MFKLYCPMGKAEMNNPAFMKWIRNCGLLKNAPALSEQAGGAGGPGKG